MRENQFYTELRDLTEDEIQMVKSIQVVKAEKAEKKMFKAIRLTFAEICLDDGS